MRLNHYTSAELHYICEVYKFAMQLFSNRFRGSGKHFLSHLVGTASILVDLHQSINVVSAGLLHAAYVYGNFGTEPDGITLKKQEWVRRVVGSLTENLISRYTYLKWNADTVPIICEQISTLKPIERAVLLIRLANELEDHLNLGILYCGNAQQRQKYIHARLHLSINMAEQLGFPSLAQNLYHVFREATSTEVLSSLQQSRDHSFVLTSWQRNLED
jgi:(p)ppGpp synthase/HD superfamily hydrolase